MKLSVFSVVDRPPGPAADERRRFPEIVRLAEEADRSGLDALWLAEHHFGATGYLPSPATVLAACGARTRRLRLGPLVSVLPFHEPVTLAEEYAVLDQLLEGRLNFGCGSGYISTELEGFGVESEAKRLRFDTALDTILRAWAGEEVRADRPSTRPVRLNVRPLQQPHPPIWIASQRREAIPFVAARGASIALIPYATMSDPSELAQSVREFRAAAPAGARGEVAIAVHAYVGEHPERGHAALQRYLDSRLSNASTFFQRKVAADPHHAHAGAIESSGFTLFGRSGAGVRSRLEEFERIGVDEVMSIVDFGELPLEDSLDTIRALGALRPSLGSPSGHK